MKIQLYSEGLRFISKSGVGKAIKHQEKALTCNNIPCQVNGFGYDYDLIHINTIGFLSVLKVIMARLKGKKVILHAHSTAEDFRNSFFFANAIAPIFKWWLCLVYGMADVLITPTPYSKKIIEAYGLGKEIEVVSNGVELDQFKDDPEGAAIFRRLYKLKQDNPIVLSVGLQIKRKGIIEFVKLAKAMPDVQFVWCGYTSPYLVTRDVRKAIKEAPSNVHFLGYLNDLVGAYSAADVFFMPTFEETEGIVMLEALAMKKPIVVRDIPVYDEWLVHGIHCYKGLDNVEFEQLITGILEHRLKDLTHKGWEVAQQRGLDKIGLELLAIYLGLVGEVGHEI